jgi:hypothetical protein
LIGIFSNPHDSKELSLPDIAYFPFPYPPWYLWHYSSASLLCIRRRRTALEIKYIRPFTKSRVLDQRHIKTGVLEFSYEKFARFSKLAPRIYLPVYTGVDRR